MYQLQGKGTKIKNIEIQRDKLVSTASVVSLRLERMLTVLSKRKEFLNEESVNTNPKYIDAPDFIGINTKVKINALTDIFRNMLRWKGRIISKMMYLSTMKKIRLMKMNSLWMVKGSV